MKKALTSSLVIGLPDFVKGFIFDTYTSFNMLPRNTYGTCTQCFQEHEDAKTEKTKTRRINVTEETRDYKWKRNSPETMQLREEINSGKNWKFTLRQNTVYTRDGKIWIPAERKHEMIKNTHILKK